MIVENVLMYYPTLSPLTDEGGMVKLCIKAMSENLPCMLEVDCVDGDAV
jgi:hypothetical protein